METHSSITLICRDQTLLDVLDEPLQRGNLHTELFANLPLWQHQTEAAPLQLLIVDLDTLRPDEPAWLLKHLPHHVGHLVLIPPSKAIPLPPLPGITTLLATRAPRLLLATIRTQAGYPGRIFMRREYEQDVLVRPQDASPFIARSGDLGFGGVFIESHQHIAPGQRVTLRFADSDFASEGCVAWRRTSHHGSRPRYGTGIQFLFPDRKQLAKLMAPPPP